MGKKEIKLQKLLLDNYSQTDNTQDMYYRGINYFSKNNQGGWCLSDSSFVEFFTYFNSFTIYKWRKYTEIEELFLQLEISGKFKIDLFGHSSKHNKTSKQWFGSYNYELNDREKINIVYPEGIKSDIVSFQISSEKDVIIYDGGYYTTVDESKIQDVKITMITTTYNKEDYIDCNVRILNKELFTEENIGKYTWYVIDNGCTLKKERYENECIKVIHNKNVGGSGGFTRGMIENLKDKNNSSHILLMDDDVNIIPESFSRLYSLLQIMKEEYMDYFIAGAMLEMEDPHIQHEDVGVLYADITKGKGPSKQRFDLNKWNSIVENEVEIKSDATNKYYSGWWYCCIPSSVVSENNLPYPFFIRGDDVEYSIRNNAKFITLNGICIWHEGFGGKFSCALNFYQVMRNDLILQAIHGFPKREDIISSIKNIFWEEIYKFNYKGADLLLDAVEDYLKGPEFLALLDGAQQMKLKGEKDNTLMDITDEIERLIDYNTLFNYIPLSKNRKRIYDYTCNGQKRLNITKKGSVGIIPYGWGYNQEKLNAKEKIYAIDVYRHKYTVFQKSYILYEEITKRYHTIFAEYELRNEMIAEQYRKEHKNFSSLSFWNQYLK